jgi:hypothetical protein
LKPLFFFIFLLTSVFTTTTNFSNDICIFTPPSSWQCADPSNLSSHVTVGYVGKGKSSFNPSLNLAKEEVDIDLKEYVKEVKSIYAQDKSSSVKSLGTIKTLAGEAVLLEICTKTSVGEIRILQAIFVKDNFAYVLTGATTKDEFIKYNKEMQQAFSSLAIVPDLISIIASEGKRSKLNNKIYAFKKEMKEKKLINNKKLLIKQIEKFQKFLATEFHEMGNYWQLLMLEQIVQEQ